MSTGGEEAGQGGVDKVVGSLPWALERESCISHGAGHTRRRCDHMDEIFDKLETDVTHFPGCQVS